MKKRRKNIISKCISLMLTMFLVSGCDGKDLHAENWEALSAYKAFLSQQSIMLEHAGQVLEVCPEEMLRFCIIYPTDEPALLIESSMGVAGCYGWVYCYEDGRVRKALDIRKPYERGSGYYADSGFILSAETHQGYETKRFYDFALIPDYYSFGHMTLLGVYNEGPSDYDAYYTHNSIEITEEDFDISVVDRIRGIELTRFETIKNTPENRDEAFE